MNGDKKHSPPFDELADGNGRGSHQYRRKVDMARVAMRVMCVAASVAAAVVMVTARQTSTASLYGFRLQLYSVWSLSDSFEYLVGVSAAATAYSLLQLLITGTRLLRENPVIPSRNQAWIFFVADQIFAYATMSAGSAALGVTNMNRTGIKHMPLPNFCKSLDSFCDHVAVSVFFTFLAFLLLALSSVLDMIMLTEL